MLNKIKKQDKKRNIKKKYKICKIFIKKTLNNVFITLTNIKGDTIVYYSTGKLGLKKIKKSGRYAEESMMSQIIKYCISLKVRYIILYYSGIYYNIDIYAKLLKANNIKTLSLVNNTPINFNGCRKPKQRRL